MVTGLPTATAHPRPPDPWSRSLVPGPRSPIPDPALALAHPEPPRVRTPPAPSVLRRPRGRLQPPDLDENRPARERQPRDGTAWPGHGQPPRHRQRHPQAQTEETVHHVAQPEPLGSAPEPGDETPRPVLEMQEVGHAPHRQCPEHEPQGRTRFHAALLYVRTAR